MEDLDALLADLHNTTVHMKNGSGGRSVPHSPTPPAPAYQGYGSLNSPRQQAKNAAHRPQSPPQLENNMPTGSYSTHQTVTERYEYRRSGSTSPIYQNQHVVRETTTSSNHPRNQPYNHPSNFTNNLSELDTLLEDLNAARYTPVNKDRRSGSGAASPAMNGPGYSPISRDGGRTSPRSPATGHPTIETLLDELQNSVPPTLGGNTSPGSRRMYSVTTERAVAPQTAASSATKELDDLMASLSDFKLSASSPQSTDTDPAYAKPQKAKTSRGGGTGGNQLESMLGTLQSDMSRQGVNTAAKGHCAACTKPIVGQVVTALGKTWHPEHFTCAHCNQELGTKNFFERDGEPYCETDYHNIFSPRCAYCNGPILDKCVTALDKTWHPEHFFCAQCGRQFGEDGFHEKDGKPYCRQDYFDMFAPKCGGCNQPITENYISALNSQWHPDCFVCRDCRQSFNGGSFYDHEGQPYCETHYHAKRGSLCAGCQKPITGRCITAMFRKFHPEHFVCSFCLKQLNKGTFKEQNDKPYCHACFEKLFG